MNPRFFIDRPVFAAVISIVIVLAGALAGSTLPPEEYAHFVDDARAQITVTDGVPELIAEVHARGGAVAAVSGGFHEVLDPLAAELGMDPRRAVGASRGEMDGPDRGGQLGLDELLAVLASGRIG